MHSVHWCVGCEAVGHLPFRTTTSAPRPSTTTPPRLQSRAGINGDCAKPDYPIEGMTGLPEDPGCVQFPDGFVWGASTASYQIEGAASEGGRGWSIWDAFSHSPGKTLNGHTGDVADDHYHRFQEDVRLMASAGIKHYRFSIAWPRIMPNGRSPPNADGIAFYNSLIDALIDAEIEPLVTLYHWDLPLALQVEMDGWLGGIQMADVFAAYAKTCFAAFGDRVKRWITINEPWCCSVLGYCTGEHAPGRLSDSYREPYRAGHTLLLAHAKATKVYRDEFRAHQKGIIGIALNCDWREPLTDTNKEKFKQNCMAAERALLFSLGWFADPLYSGDYPDVMKAKCGDRLPEFTEDEKMLLKGSCDFFALNHYSTSYCKEIECSPGAQQVVPEDRGYFQDISVILSDDPSWQKTDMGWPIVPWGIRKLLHWIQHRYAPAGGIIITENGCAVKEPSREEGQKDQARIDYLKGYISEVHKATKEGADCRGYYLWSLMDNFEWAFGYTKRFGLYWVDYETFERIPKLSLKWYSKVISNNGF